MLIKSQIESKLDAEIISLLDKLAELQKDSKEYADTVERISKLHGLKTNERPKSINPDTVLVVAANIFGILWLARYEKEHVIKAPNAFRHVMRSR